MKYKLSFKPFGAKTLLIEWPKDINADQHEEVLRFEQLVHAGFEKEIAETVVSYNSLTIYLDKYEQTKTLIEQIKQLALVPVAGLSHTINTWQLPVCYDASLGIDLQELSAGIGLSVKEIIKIHSQVTYRLYFHGFLPGFMYLGGLDKRLHFPRRAQPRQKINAGDVGIAGQQTGIYPSDSPGGWNIIGRTPVKLFDPNSETPCFTAPGDLIQFIPVSKEEYHYLHEQITQGNFDVKSLLKNG